MYPCVTQRIIICASFIVILLLYLFCVYVQACVHVYSRVCGSQRSTLGVTLPFFPPSPAAFLPVMLGTEPRILGMTFPVLYFVRQVLSLGTRLGAQRLQVACCLHSPSAGNTGIYCHVQLFLCVVVIRLQPSCL